MPFDGSEFIGTAVIPSEPERRESQGAWQRIRQLTRSLRVRGRGLPFVVPVSDPMVTPEAVSLQVLRLARSLIADEHNWIQRRYETLDGRRCAVGALRGAVRLLGVRGGGIEPHNALLSIAIARGFTDIEKMNDHSTHDQLISAFDEAIARARIG